MILAPNVVPSCKICPECGHTIKSSKHKKHHEAWQELQREAMKRSKRGIVVESIIGETLYRGVLYPVTNKIDDVI